MIKAFLALFLGPLMRSHRADFIEHSTMKEKSKRIYQWGHYRAYHSRIRNCIYRNHDQVLRDLDPARPYLIEVAVDGHRGHSLPAQISIAVYKVKHTDGHVNLAKSQGRPDQRWQDGTFYYLMMGGVMSKVRFDQAQIHLSERRIVQVYKPDYMLV